MFLILCGVFGNFWRGDRMAAVTAECSGITAGFSGGDCFARFETPEAHPEGIGYVIVKGEVVADHGVHTGARLGKSIRDRSYCQPLICRGWQYGRADMAHGSCLYASSETGSSHSLEAFSAGISTARWANHLSGAAPCQCFMPGAMCTTSPGCSSRAFFPHS